MFSVFCAIVVYAYCMCVCVVVALCVINDNLYNTTSVTETNSNVHYFTAARRVAVDDGASVRK